MPTILGRDVPESEIGKAIVENAGRMEDIRQDFEGLKQSCVDLSLPIRGELEDYAHGSSDRQGKGKKRGLKIYSDEAVLALETTVNGMMGMHISPAFDWFQSAFFHQVVKKDRSVKKWLQDTDMEVYEILRRSDTFYASIGDCLADGLGTGDGCAYVEPNHEARTVEAIVPNLWEMYYARDRFGKHSAVHRHFKLAALEAVREFEDTPVGSRQPGELRLNGPNAKLSRGIHQAIANKQPFTEFEFIHATYVNDDYQPANPFSQRYVHYWVERDFKQGHLLRVRQSATLNPIVFSVYRASDEDYGRGITGKAIVTVALDNQFSKTMLNAANWAADPAYKLSRSMSKADLGPGGRVLIDDVNKDVVEAIRNYVNWPVGDAERQRIVDLVKNHYMVKFFELFSNLEHEARVLELIEMRGEKAVSMSRFMGNINAFLDKVLDRVRAIAWRAGWLPLPPQVVIDFMMEQQGALPRRVVDVEHVGPLAQIQRQMFEVSPLQHGLQAALPILQANPETSDEINWNRVLHRNLDAFNWPVELYNTDQEKQVIKQARAELQEAQMAQEAIKTVSDAVPKLQKKSEDGSPAKRLVS